MKLRAHAGAVCLAVALGTGAGYGAAPTAQAPDGKAVYTEQCKVCHGQAGRPTAFAKRQYPQIPTFDARFLGAISEDSIRGVVTHGFKTDMKSFKAVLSAAQIAAVAGYVKATFGGAAAHD
jgi:mono/diheme cytochrome c family protein